MMDSMIVNPIDDVSTLEGRQLLPAMIGWFAQGPEPDAGLLAFRQLSEQLAGQQWYLKLLRDSATAAERLARLLSTSGFVTKALLASADEIRWLDSDADLEPRTYERLWNEADAVLRRSDDADQAITALRGIRRREIARVAAADVLGLINASDATGAVTHAADMVIDTRKRPATVRRCFCSAAAVCFFARAAASRAVANFCSAAAMSSVVSLRLPPGPLGVKLGERVHDDDGGS